VALLDELAPIITHALRSSMRARTSIRRRITTIATAGLLTIGAAAVGLITALPAHAATICEQFGSIASGNYIIMNNRWGSSQPQCISTTASGFSIIQQDGTGNLSGAPVSYPAIYLGCHYSNCSPNSPLPAQISTMGNANTSISNTYPSSGTWDAAYDIWLNADTNVTGVQDTEIMVWLNRQGSIQPIGSPTGTANLAGRTWQVWTGNNGQNNVVSYLFQGSAITSLSFNVRDFIMDTFSRGSQYGNTSWFLTSIQAGFEPWIGGVGLTVNNFSASIGGTSGNPPGTPGTPTVSNPTSSSLSLNWAASSGTVSQYQIQRCQGSTCTNFAQVGTSTSTSFTDTGLAANTTYRYRISASNSSGTSGFSGIGSGTTSGGGTGGGCTTTGSVQSTWDNGYVMNMTVTNSGTSTLTSWASSATLPAGHTVTGSWPITATVSGQIVTERNTTWNVPLGPGQSTTWGFQVSRPSGNTQIAGGFSCTGS
jgi:hypothetical protein